MMKFRITMDECNYHNDRCYNLNVENYDLKTMIWIQNIENSDMNIENYDMNFENWGLNIEN